MEEENMLSIMVIWRGKQLNVEMGPNSTVEQLGKELQELTNIKSDTMRLLVPQSANKSSKLISPFSDKHSSLSLQETAILEGKVIRMMGVFLEEIEEVSQNNMKPDLRIAGFDEEEKRLKQRLVNKPRALKLPQGSYIFCDFRTLHLPGIELNPPPSEALKRMHMLACDPGIIAIMNKHRWRVGIMTEMAPVGYVGISPKCILGFNKNQGEEISLRLRTDDLKGFRKYESIKKTLLHELAHMVYSEHDANFFALNKQLNEEADSLDWTRSRSHTLSGLKFATLHEEDNYTGENNYSGQKLGGTQNALSSARASSAAAAYRRLLDATTHYLERSEVPSEDVHTNRIIEKIQQPVNKEQVPFATLEPDSDDCELKVDQEKNIAEPDPDDMLGLKNNVMHYVTMDDKGRCSNSSMHDDSEPDPDDCLDNEKTFELDSHDFRNGEDMVSKDEPDPDDSQVEAIRSEHVPTDSQVGEAIKSEPDPDDSKPNKFRLICRNKFQQDSDVAGINRTARNGTQMENNFLGEKSGGSNLGAHSKGVVLEYENMMELDSESSQATEITQTDPDPDDCMDGLSSQELKIIEEPVTAICERLRKAIDMLRSEVTPEQATSALQTLVKIVRNVIDHPDEVKFRRLRKANPLIQRNVTNHKAAVEVLAVVGFCEDVIADEVGRAEAYLVLKRNDPGLLWLARSSLEMSIA